MKKYLYVICIFYLLSCSKNVVNEFPENSIRWDFDWDQKIEYAWLEKPSEKECNPDYWCHCNLLFSNSLIKSHKIENCIPGTIQNEWDLNNDWKDDILIFPSWFQSSWRSYSVLSYLDGNWGEIIWPINIYDWCDNMNGLDLIDINVENPREVFAWTMTDEELQNKGCNWYERRLEKINFYKDK